VAEQFSPMKGTGTNAVSTVEWGWVVISRFSTGSVKRIWGAQSTPSTPLATALLRASLQNSTT